jgi:hypothetical protein
MSRGVCALCGEPVRSYEEGAWPVRGWELERSGGGANRIALRRRDTTAIAHARCVERAAARARRGIAADQLELG